MSPMGEHPETTCERCGRPNAPTWHAPSPLWNAVLRDPETGQDAFGIVCPTCFAELAAAKGFDYSWHFGPHEDVTELWMRPGYRWDADSCLWSEAALDPDPLHVDDDQDHRVPRWDHHARPPRRDGVPGPALVLVIVGIPLIILAAIAWTVATSRPDPDPVGPSKSGAPLGRTAATGSPLPDGVLHLPANGLDWGGAQPSGDGAYQAGRSPSVRGVATWYNAPTARDAAAGPGLRRALGRHWRGSTVRVCAEARCLTTRLTDWCLCSRGDRVIDLDDRAFRQLAPLSAGVVRVMVTAAAAGERRTPTAPPTDVWQ